MSKRAALYLRQSKGDDKGIDRQLNGNLSRRDEETAALRDENARLQAKAARREAGPRHRM